MTREMVKLYMHDGKEVFTYSPASELKEAIDHTNMVPICIYKDREHGLLELPKEDIIGEAALHFNDGKIKADCYFDLEKMTPEQIKMLEDLEKDNLSPAFKTVAIRKSGSFEGVHYDEIQTQIRFYHVAVVTQGRCSSIQGCGLYRDSFDAIYVEDTQEMDTCKAALMKKGHSETVSYELCQDVLMREDKIKLPTYATDADIKKDTTDEANNEGLNMTTDEEMKTLQEQLDTAKKENDAFKEKERQLLITQVHDTWKIPKPELEGKNMDTLLELSKLKPPSDTPPGQDITDATTAPKRPKRVTKAEIEEKLADAMDAQLDHPDYKPGVTYLSKKPENQVLDNQPQRIHYDNKTGIIEPIKNEG